MGKCLSKPNRDERDDIEIYSEPVTRPCADDQSRNTKLTPHMSAEDLCVYKALQAHGKRPGLSRYSSNSTFKSNGNLSRITKNSSLYGSERAQINGSTGRNEIQRKSCRQYNSNTSLRSGGGSEYGFVRNAQQQHDGIYHYSNDSRMYFSTSDYASMGRDSRGRQNSYNDMYQSDANLENGESQRWNFNTFYLSQSGEPYYNMENRTRGFCIIFNVKNVGSSVRHGTEVDITRLVKSFRHLGFNVLVKNNPSKAEMKEVITNYASLDHSNADCFACIVLSHGRDGHIRSTKDEEVSLHEIMDPVKKCRSLLGKPKLFFIQACRGTNTDYGIVTDAIGDTRDDLLIRKLSSHIDVLVSYATVPDYVAYRNEQDGSIYIKILTELLQKEGFTTNLTCLLSKVTDLTSKSVLNVLQVPCFTSTLTKLLKFKPKKRVVKTTHHYSDGTTEEIDHDEYPCSPDIFQR